MVSCYLFLFQSISGIHSHFQKASNSFYELHLFHGVWFSEEMNCVPASHSGNKRHVLPFLALIKSGIGTCPRFGQFFNLERMWH